MVADKLCYSQIIQNNPIVQESKETQTTYLKLITKYLKKLHVESTYADAEVTVYRELLTNDSNCEQQESQSIENYRYFIILDLVHITGYDLKIYNDRKEEFFAAYKTDFTGTNLANRIFEYFASEDIDKIRLLLRWKTLEKEHDYLQLMIRNLTFSRTKPYRILVTATMSAGKSTLINALCGQRVCKAQNMACTSKIHTIFNKAFDDHEIYEYDHDLVMRAGDQELLIDNDENRSDHIYIGVPFIGGLHSQRLEISDSPGINFSQNEEHRDITDSMIDRHHFDILIYVINVTQTATTDDRSHLEYVRKHIGRRPVIFVLNKIDEIHSDSEKETIIEIIKNERHDLYLMGFRHLKICPVAAKAAFLSKKSQRTELKRFEYRELERYIDDLDELKVTDYYSKTFGEIRIPKYDNEYEHVLKTSGISYLEQIIRKTANEIEPDNIHTK